MFKRSLRARKSPDLDGLEILLTPDMIAAETRAARGESLEAIRKAIAADPEKGRVVAFTGSGGVGKSSLIGRLVELLRAKDRSVAVLCCDPQSPLTGGALLGDRLRIAKGAGDTGVFIRSIATPARPTSTAASTAPQRRACCRNCLTICFLPRFSISRPQRRCIASMPAGVLLSRTLANGLFHHSRLMNSRPSSFLAHSTTGRVLRSSSTAASIAAGSPFSSRATATGCRGVRASRSAISTST